MALKESIAHIEAFCSACERRKAKNAAAGSAASSSSSIISREKREDRREQREATSTIEMTGWNEAMLRSQKGGMADKGW